MNDSSEYTIALLRKDLKDRDDDIQKAAIFGNQLLEDVEKLNIKIEHLSIENEALQQDKYSLQLDLETQVQTVNTQSSELEIQREQYDSAKRKIELLQKENNTQKQQISNLTYEKCDLEKSQQDLLQEKCELKKKVALQQQQIQGLQHTVESSLNVSAPENLDEENDINYYKLQNRYLQEALSAIQSELSSTKVEESRLLTLVKELEEGAHERDKQIRIYSIEMQKSREDASELQCEIEALKLEQVDVNRRGNSVFGELDDRRRLIEKEYKLLVNKYDNMLENYEENKKELSRCKGRMSILLSMKSRNYHDIYIQQLDDNLRDSKREIENLTLKLKRLVKSQSQQQLSFEQVPTRDNEYNYLRVMNQQAENKLKALENELVTLRMQNMADNNALTKAQQLLYQTEEELDAEKMKNLKLTHQLQELTMKPDTAAPSKSKPRIEILPGFNLSPRTIKNIQSGVINKKTLSEDIIPGELEMGEGGFREVKPPRRSNKAILRSMNTIVKDNVSIELSPLKENDEFSTEIKYLKDNSAERNSNLENIGRPSYARYKPSGAKNRNEGNCTQQ